MFSQRQRFFHTELSRKNIVIIAYPIRVLLYTLSEAFTAAEDTTIHITVYLILPLLYILYITVLENPQIKKKHNNGGWYEKSTIDNNDSDALSCRIMSICMRW